jgi:uncharacterized protein
VKHLPVLLLLWALALACVLLPAPVRAQALLPVPPLSARVIDQTGTLSAAQRQALEDKLAAFEARAGSQLVVLVVSSTQPEDIAAYAQRVADQWKIGRRDVGDGLLLVVAKDDRRVRIEVAKALEGAVPDLAARQIIDRAIAPAFRAGDYAGGLNQAVDQLGQRILTEQLPSPERGARGGMDEGVGGLSWEELAIFFFVAVPIIGAVLTGVLGRKVGALATGGATGAIAWGISASMLLGAIAGVVALILVGVIGIGSAGRRIGSHRGRHAGIPPIIWGGGGGGWGDGGGGGGFSSGGGGDFGGGGASGDW